MTKTVTRTAAITVLAALLTGCGADDGKKSDKAAPPATLQEVGGDIDRFQAYLEAQDGIADATAEEVELDTDLYGWDADIVLTADAGADVVRDTLVAAKAFDDAARYDEPGSIELSRDGTGHALSWSWGGADRTAKELSDTFALAEERLGDEAWTLDEHGQIRLVDLADLAAISDLATRIAGDGRLAAHQAWLLSTDFDLTGNQDSHALQTTTGLDADVAAAWQDVATAAEALDHLELDNLHLVATVGPGEYVSDPPPEGSVHLGLGLDSDAPNRAALETGAIGAELHRLVEATVPALGGFPHGSEYSLDVWVGKGDNGEEIELVDLVSDEKDQTASGGTVAAQAHALLDRVD